MNTAIRYEKRYCDDCMIAHWLEVTPINKEICHGEDFTPKESPTHYTRWSAGGIELCEKVSARPNKKALEWQVAEETQLQMMADKEEYIQDW